MRQRLPLLVGGLLVVASVITPLGAAHAAEGGVISKVGWFTRNPAASAPEDGFNVGNAPDGPVSVAAIEVTSTTGLRRAVLILAEEGGIQADSAKLAVCMTPNEWNAGPAQPMDAAPKAECESNQVELSRNAASSSWAADVTSLVGDIEDEGSVSLMVVPSGDAAVPLGFEVRFQKPQLSSEASESSSTTTDFSSDFASGDTSSSGETTSSGGGFSGGSGTTMSDSSTFAPTFETSATPAPVAPTTADGAAGAPAVTDAAPAETTATTVPAELAAIPTQAGLGAGTSGGGSAVQAIFFVVLATIAGVGAGAGRWYIRSRNPDTTFA